VRSILNSKVACVQVIRAASIRGRLEVLSGVLVVLRKPGEPAGGAQLEYAEQLSSENARLPTMLILLIFRDFPSFTLKLIRPGLRSSGVTVVVTSTP